MNKAIFDDTFFVLLNDMFNKIQDSHGDGYIILKFSIPLNQLYKLYTRMEVKEIMPIEMIEETEKKRHWEIAKKFYTDKEEAIIASKASYMLSLITNG